MKTNHSIQYLRLVLLFIIPLMLGSQIKAQTIRNYTTIDNDWEIRGKLSEDEKFKLNYNFSEFNNYYIWNYGSIDPIETVIPIVFHVLYTDESKKIKPEHLVKQVEIINEYFSNKIRGPEDDPYINDAVDTKIQFCIGDKDNPNIQYKQVLPDFLSNKFDIYDEKVGLKNLEPDNVLNVWVVDLPIENAGWAQLPFRPKNTDGIVINSYYLGELNEKYNKGKTIIHLIGSYLGLLDIWSEGGCTDDYVPDTPIHDGPNWDCYPQIHISGCGGLIPEMLGNFMDNTPDECAWMFTTGQSKRMALAIRMARQGLIYNECNSDIRLVTSTIENVSNNFETNIVLYPNPTLNIIEVRSNIEISKVKILDNSGKMVKDYNNINQSNFDLNIEDLKSNFYFIQLISDKNFEVKKVIKI